MNNYLKMQFDLDHPEFLATLDELTLWAAPFGQMLLTHMPISEGMEVLDIGCGLGFPTLEIASRLGDSASVFGLDPWATGLAFAERKRRQYRIEQTCFIEGDAALAPFSDKSFDLVLSNLGINNFSDPYSVIRESYRLLKSGGYFCISTNVEGHMDRFYRVFEQVLAQAGYEDRLPQLQAHRAHRLNANKLIASFTDAGFSIEKNISDRFVLRFASGSAFLNHYFIQLAFMDAWKKLVPFERQQPIFRELEARLNAAAKAEGELTMTVPMLYLSGIKTRKYAKEK